MSNTGEHNELLDGGLAVDRGAATRGAGTGLTGPRVVASLEFNPDEGLGGVGGSSQAN